MKTGNNNGRIFLPKTKKQCKLHEQVAAFCMELDRLPNASEVRDQQAQPAPLHLLPMVF